MYFARRDRQEQKSAFQGIALGILVGPVVGAVISNQGFVAACRTLVAKRKALLALLQPTLPKAHFPRECCSFCTVAQQSINLAGG